MKSRNRVGGEKRVEWIERGVSGAREKGAWGEYKNPKGKGNVMVLDYNASEGVEKVYEEGKMGVWEGSEDVI